MKLKESSLVNSLEAIASAISTFNDQRMMEFNRLYPVKGEPREATITYVGSEDDALRASQGQTDESLEEWIGSREKRFLAGIKGSQES